MHLDQVACLVLSYLGSSRGQIVMAAPLAGLISETKNKMKRKRKEKIQNTKKSKEIMMREKKKRNKSMAN
jgi:hypothetical protein